LQPYDWEQVHAQVLRETFEELDEDRAVALVGVLDDYRILYSDRLREAVEPVEGMAPRIAASLPVERSSEVIARLYGHDQEVLIRRYRETWTDPRLSMLVLELLALLEGHRFVGKMVRSDELP